MLCLPYREERSDPISSRTRSSSSSSSGWPFADRGCCFAEWVMRRAYERQKTSQDWYVHTYILFFFSSLSPIKTRVLALLLPRVCFSNEWRWCKLILVCRVPRKNNRRASHPERIIGILFALVTAASLLHFFSFLFCFFFFFFSCCCFSSSSLSSKYLLFCAEQKKNVHGREREA